MKTINCIQYETQDAAMIAAHTTVTIDEIIEKMGGLPSGAYIYVNSSAQIEAAIVGRDATPIDEEFFIGRAW